MKAGLLIVGIGAFGASVPGVYAGTVTGTLSETTQTYGPSSVNWSTSLGFQGFTALANAAGLHHVALTSVTVSLTETMVDHYTVLNYSTTSTASGTVTRSHTGKLQVAGDPTVVNARTSSTIDVGTASTSGGYAYVRGTLTGSSSSSNTYSSNLSSFLVPYSAAASDYGRSTYSFSGGDVSLVTNGDKGTLAATVVYTYDPVPGPSSLAIFGAGLIAMMACIRRNKRN